MPPVTPLPVRRIKTSSADMSDLPAGEGRILHQAERVPVRIHPRSISARVREYECVIVDPSMTRWSFQFHLLGDFSPRPAQGAALNRLHALLKASSRLDVVTSW